MNHCARTWFNWSFEFSLLPSFLPKRESSLVSKEYYAHESLSCFMCSFSFKERLDYQQQLHSLLLSIEQTTLLKPTFYLNNNKFQQLKAVKHSLNVRLIDDDDYVALSFRFALFFNDNKSTPSSIDKLITGWSFKCTHCLDTLQSH